MLRRLLGSNSASAAVEMALVAPLILVLMFGAMELGFYFYSEHVVVKAVRDGARFASRASFSKFDCSTPTAGTVNAAVKSDTQRVTRTDQVAAGGSARIRGWTDDSSVVVGVRCDTSGTYGAIYDGMSSVPVVTVTATVAYMPLLAQIGFTAKGFQLQARSEAPVMGI